MKFRAHTPHKAGQPLKRADGQQTNWDETLRKLREIRAARETLNDLIEAHHAAEAEENKGV